ncbi:DUF362 domain-containing protein [Elusimicrobiota bacterium]
MNKVIVKQGKNGYRLVMESLAGLDLSISAIKNKRILIKPNAGRMVGAGTGINTSPEVVAGVIDYFLNSGINNIMIGESPILGVRALEALEECGIAEVARKRDIPLIDLDKEEPVIVDISDGEVIKTLKICRKVIEADYVVSVPVMKTHMHTQVSLGIKNLKGCLYKREKVKLHQLSFSDDKEYFGKPLDYAIADMSIVLKPDLTVIDGTIGQEGLGPSAGNPIKTGLVVSSEDCLSADTTAALLMGYELSEIAHLKLISEKKQRESM